MRRGSHRKPWKRSGDLATFSWQRRASDKNWKFPCNWMPARPAICLVSGRQKKCHSRLGSPGARCSLAERKDESFPWRENGARRLLEDEYRWRARKRTSLGLQLFALAHLRRQCDISLEKRVGRLMADPWKLYHRGTSIVSNEEAALARAGQNGTAG